MRVKVNLPGANQLIRRKGIDRDGDVQMFHTMNVNRRIGKYMPHLSGFLESKQKRIRSSTEIEVIGPQSKYLYFGKKMVNAKTGKGPALIPGVGYRYRKGTVLKVTDKDLNYTKTHNPLAGPYWDRRMIAAEGKVMQKDLQDFIARRRK